MTNREWARKLARYVEHSRFDAVNEIERCLNEAEARGARKVNDELLETVKALHEEHCARYCTTFTPSFHTDDCKKAQALLSKIDK